jgi:hypothetical protein
VSLVASAGAAAAAGGVELADIIHAYGELSVLGRPLSSHECRILADLEACRTARLGGHREHCEACGFERFAYNSCRNRHCPKCQSLATAQWLDARRAELLPVPYFHVVFTLPHELNDLVLAHKRPLLNLLFRAAADTLQEFAHNHYGGRLGFTMILHTWDQTLRPHFHLHALVPAGALATDGSRWVHGDPRFLFPVSALGKVFRGKFRHGLSRLRDAGNLTLSAGLSWAALGKALRTKRWVVHAKAPFAGPQTVLDYLGRYTHRVAISNDRILDLHEGKVTFAYRDRARGDVPRTMTLPAEQFLARFLLHVLPRGFMRIRHFGFLANRTKAEALARCRRLLAVAPPPPAERRTPAQWILHLTGVDVTRCPRCGHRPLIQTPLPRSPRWGHPPPPVFDSS